MKINCSLAELATELKINKSRLAFYVSQKLIKPESVVGRMGIFGRLKTVKTLNAIQRYQEEGKTLAEIKKLIKP